MKRKTIRRIKNFLQSCRQLGIKSGSVVLLVDDANFIGTLSRDGEIKAARNNFPKIELIGYAEEETNDD